MNRDEKRALISFLTLYSLSALVLMAMIAFLYYHKALEEIHTNCKNDLQNTLMTVEMDLRKASMAQAKYFFDPKRYKLHVGLFDNQYHPVASSIAYTDINFSTPFIVHPHYIHMTKRLTPPVMNIKYIVAEDTSLASQIQNLKLLVTVTLLISMLFVALIGYLLSRMLLAPARERIEALNRFINDATHEINTPVTALLMSVSALKKKKVGEEKLLRHISISSKQIANIYNSLSHVSFDSHKPTQIKRLDLKKAIQRNIAFFEEIAQSKQITMLEDLHSVYILMDREDIDKLIGNLLSNAIKYSPANTIVRLTLKEAVFQIKDQGIGISKTDQQKIFKRYTRASNLGGGFGIGLDIVNTICLKYNIKLTMHSKEGEGTAFILDFSTIIHQHRS